MKVHGNEIARAMENRNDEDESSKVGALLIPLRSKTPRYARMTGVRRVAKERNPRTANLLGSGFPELFLS
jgi:hypothetical protein